jgi:hypothetical protein
VLITVNTFARRFRLFTTIINRYASKAVSTETHIADTKGIA